MKYWFLCIMSFVIWLPAFGDSWRVEISKEPPGAYVHPEKQGSQRDALVGWVGPDLAETVLGPGADWSARLDKLKSAADNITNWESVGMIILTSSKPSSLRLNTAIQQEWVKSNEESKTGKSKCWWADRSGALATARVAILGLTSEMNQEDLDAFTQNRCQALVRDYYPTKATSQMCMGRVLCQGQAEPVPVICDVTRFEDYNVLSTGDPSQLGRCPEATECLSQYKKRSFPRSGPAVQDSAGESDRSIQLGHRGAGSVCFYEAPGAGYGKKAVLCFTTAEHCPSLESCKSLRSCESYAPVGWR